MRNSYTFPVAMIFCILLGTSSFTRPMMPPATTYYTIMGGNLDAFIWSTTSHTGSSCSCAPCLCDPCNLPANVIIRIAHPVTVNCNIVIGSNTTLIIESGGSLEVTGNSSITGTGNLQVDTGGSMSVSGDLNLGGTGTVIVDGEMHVGGDLNMSGTSYMCGSGTVVIDGAVNGDPCDNLVLPVELLSFAAVLDQEVVNLYWSTASETNNAYFTIERSADAKTWNEIQKVNAAGTTSQLIEYADIDPQPLQGISYYRLKQTDTDGNFAYSHIAVVKNSKGHTDITPFPNPPNGNDFSLALTGFGDEDVLVVIRDIQGKEYYSCVHVLKDRNNVIAIDLESRLSAGTYLVIASSEEVLVSKKIVVK